jgi:hypothetical protein
MPASMAEIPGTTAWMFLFSGQAGLSSAWQTVLAKALNSALPKSPSL